ncbi:MAG: Activator of Hsp90 ATPase 1 family protein [Glaciihabitans sp.]|nr:Activator of Hsp90 ATPase 1 family protein [Glaciihabitans sp.]
MAETAPFDWTYAEADIPEGIPAGNGRTPLEMTEHGYTSAEVRDLCSDGLDRCVDTMAALVEGGR